jgi:choline dehydrogenase-like flavoprotein
MGQDTSVDCEVSGMSGLYVVDGSVLPSLPAKSHTFTVMANALRAGTKLAERLTAGGAGS